VASLRTKGASVQVAHRLEEVGQPHFWTLLLIVWTARSVRSADLYEIARVHRSAAGDLVYVFEEGVSVDELPPTLISDRIKSASMADIEGVWDVLRSSLESMIAMSGMLFSMGRGPRAEGANERLEREAVQVAAGKLVYAIPSRMFLREPEEIEIRIGRDGAPRLFHDTAGSAPPIIESLPTVELMSVRVRAKPTDFQVDAMSPDTQLVGGPVVDGFGADQRQFGEWHFEITPHRTGVRRLFIEVAGEVYTEDGQSGSRHLMPKEYAVDVRVSGRLYLRRAIGLGTGVVGAVITGLIGTITQEWWLPIVRQWIAYFFD
jgi:hypothetical protein